MSSQEYKQRLTDLLHCNIEGPYGSSDRDIPFDVDELYMRLNEKDSDLYEAWKRKNILSWKASLEAAKKPYVPAVDVIGDSGHVLLEGDKCVRCTRKRLAIMNCFKGVREILKSRYFTETGKKWGIVVGFQVNGTTTWHDVVAVRKTPETFFFRVELEILEGVEAYDESIGNFWYPLRARWKLADVRKSTAPICLLNYFSAHFDEMQPFVLFHEKLHVESDPDDGWVLRFSMSSAPDIVSATALEDSQTAGNTAQESQNAKTPKRRKVNTANPTRVARTFERDLSRNTGNLWTCISLSYVVFVIGGIAFNAFIITIYFLLKAIRKVFGPWRI